MLCMFYKRSLKIAQLSLLTFFFQFIRMTTLQFSDNAKPVKINPQCYLLNNSNDIKPLRDLVRVQQYRIKISHLILQPSVQK